MSEQEIDVDLEEEQESILVDPVPGYLTLDEGDQKNEARRAFILSMLANSGGVPAQSYAGLLVDLEALLRDGATPKPQRGFTTLPGGKKGGA